MQAATSAAENNYVAIRHVTVLKGENSQAVITSNLFQISNSPRVICQLKAAKNNECCTKRKLRTKYM